MKRSGSPTLAKAESPRGSLTKADTPSLASLALLGNALEDGLVFVDLDRRVRYVNPEACRALDGTPATARSRAAAQVLRTAVPGEDLFAEIAAHAAHSLHAESPRTRETLLLTRTGAEVPARVTVLSLGDGACALVRDLTQAQRL